jgi:phospholipid transport system substrate-binding protein
MKNSLVAGLFCSLLAVGVPQAYADGSDTNPHTLVADITLKVLAIIDVERAAIVEQPALLENLLQQHLLPHVDYKFAALKVLGKNFKKVPKDRLPEYVKVFRKYLITTYADALFKFDGYNIVFASLPTPKNQKITTIRAVVSSAGKPDINVAFKARYNSKTGEWKVYDMIAEGISLLSAKQSEVSALLRKDGIDGVIESMRKKSNFVIPQE